MVRKLVINLVGYRTSTSGDGRIVCSSETSIDGFWGSKTAEFSVGMLALNNLCKVGVVDGTAEEAFAWFLSVT